MRAKIDINEVETRTKIRAKYVRAMENEEWDLLPGEVYVRSFLRTYGEFLGLDPRELVDDFRRQYERPSDHEGPPIAPPGRERHGRRDRPRKPHRMGVPGWAVIGVVLAAVVVVLYIVGNNPSDNGSPTTTHAHAAKPRHHSQHHAHHRAAARAPARGGGAKSVKLQLQPTGAVYVCLVNGNGKTLIPGQIFDVGQTIPTESGRKLLLTLGNANVTMKVNGAPVTVAPSSTSIGFELTPGAHTSLPANQQPTCS